MRLSIIIVNWNTRDLLRQTLQSIFQETENLTFEILVVDNHSADDSVEMIKRDFPSAFLIKNQDNLGFAKANNQALKLAKGDYLMLLNSDTIVLDKAIKKLVEYFDNHPDVIMVGPRLLNKDMTFQQACRRRLPNIKNSFFHLFGLVKIFKNSQSINNYKRYSDDPDETGETEALSGAAMLFRNQAYEKIGGLDESFFMYGEDLDFCKRIIEQGGKIHYVAEARIIHLGGASSAKRRTKSLVNFYEAMWLYYDKHFRKKNNPCLNGIVWLGIKVRLCIALLYNGLK